MNRTTKAVLLAAVAVAVTGVGLKALTAQTDWGDRIEDFFTKRKRCSRTH